MTGSRLLHVAPYSPADWGSGGHTRLAATLAALAGDWEVDGCYASELVDAGAVPAPRPRWRDTRGAGRDRLRRVQRLLALRAGRDSSDFFAVSSPQMIQEVRRRAAAADVAVVEFGQMAPCRPPGVPSVLVTYDLTWVKAAAQHATTAGARGTARLERWRLDAERAALERLELRHYGRFDRVVVVSDGDARLLRAAFAAHGIPGTPPVTVSPNGIDWAAYEELPARGGPGTAAFVGGLDHPPNADAIAELRAEIVPAAGEALDTLYLAGAATDQFHDDRIHGLGSVPDIRDVYARASFTVAPIRWGSGSRLKILESMAARRPVVAYAAAAEGLEALWDDEGLVVVGSQDELVAVTRRLAGDPDEAAARGLAARAAVASYDWSLVLRPLREAVRAAASAPAARPATTGQPSSAA